MSSVLNIVANILQLFALWQVLGREHEALFTLLSVVSRFAPAPQNPFGRFSELKQQRRRRQRKRHLKSEVALLQTLSRLFHFVQFFQFFKCWQFFLKLTNSKRLYRSSSKKKKAVVLCSRLPQNVELGIFTSQSCSDGNEMYKKA